MRRRQDWPVILAHMIAEAHGQPFAWGSHDCVLWACDVVRAMSVDGIDLARRWRGRYASAAGAARRVHGVATSLEEAVAAIAGEHGLHEVQPLYAWRGDLALADTELGPSIGIMADAGAAFVASFGLTFLARSAVRRAWRVA